MTISQITNRNSVLRAVEEFDRIGRVRFLAKYGRGPSSVYYLQLDEGRESDAAMLKALDRLVENKLLRPALIGKLRRFDRLELDRFIERQTEIYGECA